jgi:TPR repeat protein
VVNNARIIGVVLALGLMGAVGYLLGERSAAAPGVAPSPQERALPLGASPSTSPSQQAPRLANAPAAGRGAAVHELPLPPVNTPVASALVDLKKQAEAGNNQAACRVAFELDRCHNIPRMQRGAASFATLATQPGMGPELVKRYAAIAEREQARVFELQRICQGVSVEETGEAWRYLLQAARAGHGPSMARYANRRTLWDEDPIRVLDGLIAFRAEGPGFLQGAAQMGYPEAYEQLAFALVNGPSLGLDIPVDRVRGLAYYLALMRTATPEETARLQRTVDYAMQKENLSQQDLARARTLAEPLAVPLLRRNPPGSVDFTGGTYTNDNGSHCEN